MDRKRNLINPDDYAITPPADVPTVPTQSQISRKGKPGRKKLYTCETRTLNIVVPLSLYEKMDIAKLKYGNNMTRYVNEVIQKDLEVNYELYLKLKEILG